MIKIILLTVFGLTLSYAAFSKNIVDVYGCTGQTSEEIIKKYAKSIAQLEEELLDELKKMNFNNTAEGLEKIVKKKNRLQEKIKKENDFLDVDFETVIYPDDDNHYTTIEVIEKGQIEKLRYIDKPTLAKNNKQKNDLIMQMIDFERIEAQLMANKQLDIKNSDCPVYHCVSGFHHPKLKPYLNIFNTGAVKEKQLILKTLAHDSNPERRAAAAFLIGHFNDPEEIVSYLLPHVNADNSIVRNNVIRVIGATIMKSKQPINVMPFIELLSSPKVTDRNKSLYVLLTASESNSSKPLIIQHGGEKLISLLQLKQPNNHNPAYTILKKISGKNFDEQDFNSWRNWLRSTKVTA